jgi:hypothetical protein
MQPPAPDVLREYALLADGHRGIVVGPHGDMAWCCFPRWDSPAVFSALLGADGFYLIRPRGRHTWGGHYEAGSLVWRSRWVTEDGLIECRDALAYPGSADRAVVLRQLSVEEESVEVEVRLQLRREFGRGAPTRVRRQDNGWWACRLGDLYVRWSGVPGARYDERSGTFRSILRLQPGQRSTSYSSFREPNARMTSTLQRCGGPPSRRGVQRCRHCRARSRIGTHVTRSRCCAA